MSSPPHMRIVRRVTTRNDDVKPALVKIEEEHTSVKLVETCQTSVRINNKLLVRSIMMLLGDRSKCVQYRDSDRTIHIGQ